MTRLLLTGDIGGTNARLALFELHETHGARPHAVSVASTTLETQALDAKGTLLDAILSFVGDAAGAHASPALAVLACAGPVRNGRCDLTNLSTVLTERALREGLGGGAVTLVNDFVAMARGAYATPRDELFTLREGRRDPNGVRLVLGAGTGLGHAWVAPFPGRAPKVFSSEAAHRGFAPRDAFEDGLLTHLRTLHEHPSVEHLVSGPGLVTLFEYALTTGASAAPNEVRDDVRRRGARAISERAGVGVGAREVDAACHETVSRFATIFGAHAGDMALSLVPTGGVLLAAEIAAVVLPSMREQFLEAFLAKGKLRGVLESIPVDIVMEKAAGLDGALAIALDLAQEAFASRV